MHFVPKRSGHFAVPAHILKIQIRFGFYWHAIFSPPTRDFLFGILESKESGSFSSRRRFCAFPTAPNSLCLLSSDSQSVIQSVVLLVSRPLLFARVGWVVSLSVGPCLDARVNVRPGILLCFICVVVDEQIGTARGWMSLMDGG